MAVTSLGPSTLRVTVGPVGLSVPDDGIGLLELPRDADGVVRRIPAELKAVEGDFSGFAAVLVARTGRIMPKEIRLAPAWHPESIPTYALIDVLRCAQTAPEGLRAVFAGKVLLVGTTLPEEDRRLAPSRFIASPPSIRVLFGPRLRELRATPSGLDRMTALKDDPTRKPQHAEQADKNHSPKSSATDRQLHVDSILKEPEQSDPRDAHR